MSVCEQLFCCNPFKEERHSHVVKNLRPIQEWMVNLVSGVNLNSKVCSKCRMKLNKLRKRETDDSPEEGTGGEPNTVVKDSDDIVDTVASEVTIELLNSSLQAVGESPIKKKRLQEKQYPKKKAKKVIDVLENKVFKIPSNASEEVISKCDSEIISQLKIKFKSTTKRSEKIQILTILPQSWSIKKIEEEFQVSNYMARKAKDLVKKHGILSIPNPKPGRTLSLETVKVVETFYTSDDISRCMPGKKDFVSVKEDGKRVQKQKRLFLSNLNEAYVYFKQQHPDTKIGLSRFCMLRPKHVVLAGASGTHSVCVCTQHQNVKLMVIGAKLKELTSGSEIELNSYKDCLSHLICNPSLPKCYFGNCEECPGEEKLKNSIYELFELNLIDEISYKQWIHTDRSTLETITHSAEEFLDILSEKLKALLRHSFIAEQQASFQTELKSKLHQNECIVLCDFAENYSFVLQDEIQSYHWNNSQATIHPFVIYYKDMSNTLNHMSYIIISEYLIHDTTAVHLFQRHLLLFLSRKLENLKHIYYFSDGCAAQYKNKKNFINLCNHEVDFGVTAEWHFYATSHGKGPCDGVAGTVKRLAAHASLQRPYNNQIMTPLQLHNWCVENIKSCTFQYLTAQQHRDEELGLSECFKNVKTVSGTQKLHAFIPITSHKLITKTYSNSGEFKEESLRPSQAEINLEDISGFVACIYADKWWIGCVLSVEEDTDKVKVMLLHPNGPASAYAYPMKQDIRLLNKKSIIGKVDLHTTTGRTYNITILETDRVIKLFRSVQ